MSPAEAADAIRRKASTLRAAVTAAERRTVTEAQGMLVKRSSGTLRTKTLRKMGHPYARRAPQTPIDPSIVNTQGGKFRRSWKKAGPRMKAGGLRSSVTNSDPKSKYFFGGGRMVARRPDIWVADRIRRIRRVRIRYAIRQALKS